MRYFHAANQINLYTEPFSATRTLQELLLVLMLTSTQYYGNYEHQTDKT